MPPIIFLAVSCRSRWHGVSSQGMLSICPLGDDTEAVRLGEMAGRGGGKNARTVYAVRCLNAQVTFALGKRETFYTVVYKTVSTEYVIVEARESISFFFFFSLLLKKSHAQEPGFVPSPFLTPARTTHHSTPESAPCARSLAGSNLSVRKVWALSLHGRAHSRHTRKMPHS